METLPQEIIFDILLRLPVKSVVQCRCVCKSWRSLISKSQFVKTHLKRAITDDVSVGCQRLLVPNNYIRKSGSVSLESIDYEALQLLSEQKLKEARKNKGGNNACTVLPFPWSSLMYHLELLGSCHGMVGMVVNDEKIVICNPCTREFRELPKPTSMPFVYMKKGGGLGYDSSVDDYKFIIAFNVKDDNGSNFRIKAEVFSLRSNSWRMLHDVEISCFRVNGPGVFLNGALHWIARCETGQMIISFDMATEKFQELFPVPPNPGYNYNYPRYDIYEDLIVLGGYLSVSCGFSGGTQVWVMKEYGVEASWTKLFTLDDMCFLNEPHFHYMRPLCFSKNGELLVNVDHHIIIYNPKEQTYRKLYKGCWWKDLIVAYTESLVSPNGNVEYNYLMSKTSSNSHRKKTKIEEYC